jgi:cyclopropane fatty-acyl-phospholipid synthase-like methyltransferase
VKTIVPCEILGCGWTLDTTLPENIETPPAALDDIFGAGVLVAAWMHTHAQKMERELETHYQSHTTQDWLRTVRAWHRRLDATLDKLEEKLSQRRGSR